MNSLVWVIIQYLWGPGTQSLKLCVGILFTGDKLLGCLTTFMVCITIMHTTQRIAGLRLCFCHQLTMLLAPQDTRMQPMQSTSSPFNLQSLSGASAPLEYSWIEYLDCSERNVTVVRCCSMEILVRLNRSIRCGAKDPSMTGDRHWSKNVMVDNGATIIPPLWFPTGLPSIWPRFFI